MTLLSRLGDLISEDIPLPGGGKTRLRHKQLMDVGREDLSLARLAEAHWDAVAILAEAGRKAKPGAIYGVWASEIPGQSLRVTECNGCFALTGTKMFCSGSGIVDRALVTSGDGRLIDIDLKEEYASVVFDHSVWKTAAFKNTRTATVTFNETKFSSHDFVGGPDWYLNRPGFWHGACGPAACWAGGALGLVDFAKGQSRDDPHTRAHLGAMYAAAWALRAFLDTAGAEIDEFRSDIVMARIRALTLRHLVEQAATEVLRRLPRAFGPHPLAMNEDVSRRCQELDIYLRQSHAERDLETLGVEAKMHSI